MKKYFLILFSLLAFAYEIYASTETIPATQSTTDFYWTFEGNTGTLQSLADSACAAYMPRNYPSVTNQGGSITDTGYFSCKGKTYTGAIGYYGGFQASKGSALYTCPDSTWTLSGVTCTRTSCSSGYDVNAQGQCVKNCENFAGKPTPNGSGYSFAGAVSDWSVAGCKVKCNVKVLAQEGGSGQECTYTGASANPSQPEPDPLPPNPEKLPPESPKDCLASGQGYIQSSSGKTTCVAQEQAPEGQKPKEQQKDSEKEKGTPGTDGKPDPNAPDYEKQTKSESNKDGKVTTTESSTKNGTLDGNGNVTCSAGYTLNPDGKTCTKTTVTSTSASDYCKENPTSTVCKGTEASDECIKNPKRVGCFEAGSPEDSGELETHEFSPSVLPVEVMPSNNSCPADIPLPGNQKLSFSSYCQLADLARPIVLAFAWMLATFIVLGFSKGGNS